MPTYQINPFEFIPEDFYRVDGRWSIARFLRENGMEIALYLDDPIYPFLVDNKRDFFDLIRRTLIGSLSFQNNDTYYPRWDIESRINITLHVRGVGAVRLDRALNQISTGHIKQCPITLIWQRASEMYRVPEGIGTNLDGEYVTSDSFVFPMRGQPISEHRGFWRCPECDSIHFNPMNIYEAEYPNYGNYCSHCQDEETTPVFSNGPNQYPSIRNPRPYFGRDEDDMLEDEEERGQYGYGYSPLHLYPGFLKSKKEGGDKPVARRPRISNYPLRTRYHMRDTTRYYGVEYECVFDGRAPFEGINQCLREFAISTYDSSIGDGDHNSNGVEIISVPATLKVHRERWKNFFDDFSGDFDRLSNNEVGCHVHVSRDSINRLTARKLFYFLNRPTNQEFLLNISRRNRDDLDRWCTFREDVFTSPNFPIDNKYSVLTESPNHPTYELRLFAWPFEYQTLIAQIEFFDSLIDYCDECSIKKLDFISYLDWIKDKRRKRQFYNLYEYLKRKHWLSVEGQERIYTLPPEAVEREKRMYEKMKRQKEEMRRVLQEPYFRPMDLPSDYRADQGWIYQTSNLLPEEIS